jgi:hypothetical protein
MYNYEEIAKLHLTNAVNEYLIIAQTITYKDKRVALAFFPRH